VPFVVFAVGTAGAFAYLAMNFSVSSRATLSGRRVCGDFIRYELASDALVQRQLAAAHGVDHDPGRAGRVPHLELELEIQRHVAEGLALDADVGPLAS
jgi:hypothetical protein